VSKLKVKMEAHPPIDITRDVLLSMKRTIEHWLKHPGPIESGGNRVDKINYVGIDRDGYWVYDMEVTHDQSTRMHRKLRGKSGYDMILTMAKYIGWDTQHDWANKVDKATVKPRRKR
jgi:hypothetical protein